jgi:hypothetical protein
MQYTIFAQYKGNTPEEIETAETLEQAETLVGEYSMAFGQDFLVWYATLM